MIRRGYKYAVRWIAINDSPGLLGVDAIADLHTVGLVADLFGRTELEVATKVARYRHAVREGSHHGHRATVPA